MAQHLNVNPHLVKICTISKVWKRLGAIGYQYHLFGNGYRKMPSSPAVKLSTTSPLTSRSMSVPALRKTSIWKISKLSNVDTTECQGKCRLNCNRWFKGGSVRHGLIGHHPVIRKLKDTINRRSPYSPTFKIVHMAACQNKIQRWHLPPRFR